MSIKAEIISFVKAEKLNMVGLYGKFNKRPGFDYKKFHDALVEALNEGSIIRTKKMTHFV